MIPAEIIRRKRDGNSLSKDELKWFIQGYTNNRIPDHQMAAFLMATFFNGMTHDEVFSLVEVMLQSGERMDFSHMDIYVADKHSTGGVGDKVSLILGPLLAAAGLAIPMISGRSLGHTGGTLDKLETIPGFNVDIPLVKFKHLVEEVGIAMIGQTREICPADKKMYALRDVTGTISSIPLICGSIMSKKIAEGIQGLVLDVKIGSGAFMKTMEEGRQLGSLIQVVGEAFDVTTDVVFTSMDQPLGRKAGLWCEVEESIDCMQGKGPEDTMRVVYELGSRLLLQARKSETVEAATDVLKSLIHSGRAYEKFMEMVQAQGGDSAAIADPRGLHRPKVAAEIKAGKNGIIHTIDTFQVGMAAVELGCGRSQLRDAVDPTAGLEFLKKIGDNVQAGETIIHCFNSQDSKLKSAIPILESCIQIGDGPADHTLVLADL